MSRKIFIFDTTLRDGEQSPGASLNSSEKLEIARQLKKLNVDIIEAGFPISSQEDFDSVSVIAREIKGPVVICALARAKDEDIARAAEALKYAEKPMIHTFIGTSNLQVFDVLKKTREQVLEMAVKAVKLAKSYTQEVEFSAMDASRTDLAYLCEIIQATITAGATVINIPDTAGYAIPGEFGSLINRLSLAVPELRQGTVRLSVHCHDDLGMATANSIEAIQVGASQIECAVNGMGERAGNAALEEVVMAIKTRGEYLDAYTDIKTQEIINTSRLISRLSGFLVPPNKSIVGVNAFSHSSGIHQDGVLKERSTFEIMLPQDVGLSESVFVLTSRSGRHALRHRLSELGYDIPDDKVNKVYETFMALADKKKQVYDEDLLAIIQNELPVAPQIYSLEYMQVIGGTEAPVAVVCLQKGKEAIREVACGNGPLDAVCKAIDKITGVKVDLASYSLNAVTKGKDAMAEAMVRITVKGDHSIAARGTSTDIVEASAKAYINAINKLLASRGPAIVE
ncbi:MAG: 2-isopropylmalate synthase [Candidatus Gribaldobacteria bacterium]|nr:2-isopropylmalate synthase [Candidatus Gribaldobacteria bacterium]